MKRSLAGGQVQRISLVQSGAREVATLQVRVPGETVHLVVASGLGAGVLDAALRDRLRAALPRAAAAAQAHWRARLENARVVAVDDRGIDLVREHRALRASDVAGALRLEVKADAPAAALPVPDGESPAHPGPPEDDDARLSARGARIVDQLERAGTGDRRDALRRALGKAIARIERRKSAVLGDLANIARTEAAAERARLFVAEAARAPRGARVLRVLDWTQIDPDGTPAAIEMPLDPAKGAKEQIDALFRRARRMKEGARVASARLHDATAAQSRLGELRAALDDPGAPADFDALEAAARAAAPRDFKLSAAPVPGRARAGGTAPRPPYRTFVAHGDSPVYVGRGAVHNDALTLHVARPHDLWLHAKGYAGAHVVVPLDKGASCPAEVLIDAAHLAAHFSDARGERVVEVQTTPRRYLRKPRGSAPGAVIVDREKVLVLRVDDERLRQLLASEIDL
ncbi:MAG: NFACT RNA binding domain-containing protein [Polyangiaceae bacterium]|nr:NFACT RNA binding domain-containing protein [Polyangiaceae bacterium]